MLVQIKGNKYRIRWRHHIPPTSTNKMNGGLKSQYGTECFVETEAKARVLHGVAFLHPKDENSYCRRVGRRVSLTRALKDFDRETRAQVWNQVLSQNPKIVKP